MSEKVKGCMGPGEYGTFDACCCTFEKRKARLKCVSVRSGRVAARSLGVSARSGRVTARSVGIVVRSRRDIARLMQVVACSRDVAARSAEYGMSGEESCPSCY